MKAGHYVSKVAAIVLLSLVPPGLADARETGRVENGRTVVEAPTTRVETEKGRTKVEVRAPGADVDVDTERRRVRIRVPFFNGDVRW